MSIPLALTLLRACLAPVVVALALWSPSALGFAICIVVAFLSDVFDGVIARRLGIATPNLRRLDSIADTIFYLGVAFAIWHLHRAEIVARIIPVIALAALELLRYAVDLRKFGREASYHMWSSRLWGVALLVGTVNLLVLGNAGWTLDLAIYAGIVADLEGLAISFTLSTWKSDVPTWFHARQIAARR